MPVSIKKQGSQFCVVEPGGKVVKCHPTKEKANKHAAAINIAKHKSSAELIAEEKFKAEGLEAPAVSAPPIIIVSDGTPEGTKLMLQGELVAFKRMDLYCSKGGEYSSCSMSVTMEETGQDGMSVEKTITLRKEQELEND